MSGAAGVVMATGRLGRLVVIGFVAVQQILVVDVRIGGVHPDIMILLPIVAGIVGGPPGGPRWASARAWWPTCSCPRPSVSRRWWDAARLRRGRRPPWPWTGRAWWLPPVAAPGRQRALRGGLRGRRGRCWASPRCSTSDLMRILVMVSVVNAVLAMPALRLVTWALPAASTEGVPTSAVSPGCAPVTVRSRPGSRTHAPGPVGYWAPREPIPAPPVPRDPALSARAARSGAARQKARGSPGCARAGSRSRG